MSATTSDEARAAAVASVRKAGEQGMLSDGAVENVTRWLNEPQYAEFAPAIAELVDAGDFEQLDRLFWEVIPFGTGGRRGMMADLGSATINVRTIAESAHGLASYLRETKGEGGRAVVAHDTRNRSREFAELTATTLAAHGLTVFLFESHRSTPALSFAVRHRKCDLGVMITASHNPPSDNGFKAYWDHGGQVLAPHDAGIIDHVLSAGEIPTIDFEEAVEQGRIKIVGPEIDNAYLAAVEKQSLGKARDVRAIFSPLHGVGEGNCFAIAQRLGFEGVELFEPHRKPDGNFPNVADHFPNPERTQVFEPLMERGREIGADVLLASDPDADRVGVCVRNAADEYVPLTGNQIAALCVDHALRHRQANGTLSPEHYVVLTMVTTPLVTAIAKSYGVDVVDDLLVGFKYIGETMERRGADGFVFGAEESLGYLAGGYARDKDAAIGTLFVLELAAELKAEGKTLLDRLDELYVAHGYHLEGQTSKYCEGSEGAAQIKRLMQAFRDDPPAELSGATFDRVRDYGTDEVRSLPDNAKVEAIGEPSGNLLFLESEGGDVRLRIAVRPSGTEPKIKFYFFARSAAAGAERLAETKRATRERLAAVQEGLSRWLDDTLATGN